MEIYYLRVSIKLFVNIKLPARTIEALSILLLDEVDRIDSRVFQETNKMYFHRKAIAPEMLLAI